MNEEYTNEQVLNQIKVNIMRQLRGTPEVETLDSLVRAYSIISSHNYTNNFKGD